MLSGSPKVSVCIPTYNRAEMLCESAASVLRQTFSDFELIISDNASEDATKSVVRRLEDKRIVYVRNSRNLGPLENMNRCLRLARGQFIAFLPDDDVMLRENLAHKVAVLEENPELGLVHSSYHVIDKFGQIVKANTNWGHGPDRALDGMEDRRELLAGMYNRINLSTVLFRRACYERLGGFTSGFAGEIGLAFDYEYWMRIAVYYEVAFLAKPLVNWRIHPDSLTNTRLVSDEHRRLKQVLGVKGFLLKRHGRGIPCDLRREMLDRSRCAVLRHVTTALEATTPNASARLFLLKSAWMFPGILRQKEAWKLLLKSMLSRPNIERLKRFVPT